MTEDPTLRAGDEALLEAILACVVIGCSNHAQRENALGNIAAFRRIHTSEIDERRKRAIEEGHQWELLANEYHARLMACKDAADHDSRPMTDFELSFPEIRAVFDCAAERDRLATELELAGPAGMEEEVLALQRRVREHEELEARLCPEDQGFAEYIAFLNRRAENAEALASGRLASFEGAMRERDEARRSLENARRALLDLGAVKHAGGCSCAICQVLA